MVEPRIPRQQSTTKICPKCFNSYSTDDFARTHSIFYKDGRLPICNGCITNFLRERDFAWDAVDKVCQWADIPFIVKEFERLRELNNDQDVWSVYAKVFAEDDYKSIGWNDYYRQYVKLKENGLIEDEIPLVREQKLSALRKKWGANYDDDELYRLDSLLKGIKATQNVSGTLQQDQAEKLCKLSLEIDSRIRAGDKDVDKFLSSYDKLIKAAEFTPKNTKNAVDFDSIGEFMFWLEKRGRINKFYDNVTRDVIDETLKNIQNWNQRLYINEGGLGEEITQRLQLLKHTQEREDFYETQQDFDSDQYETEAFAKDDEEEFDAGGNL